MTGVRQTISVDELVTSAALDHEGLGTLDSPLVVVDLASAPEVPAAAVEALRTLPCVLVGVGEEATPGTVGTSLDVVASDPAVVDAIEQMVASTPARLSPWCCCCGGGTVARSRTRWWRSR